MENFDMPEQNVSEEASRNKAQAVEFRFVSGPNNGAMLRLEAGEYFIGNTADSEVVFALDRQDSIEFVIGIGEDRDVYARSRSGTVYLYNSDGTVLEQLSPENVPLPEGTRIGVDFESLVWFGDWNAVGGRWRTVSEDEMSEAARSEPGEPPAPEAESETAPAQDSENAEEASGEAEAASGTDADSEKSGEPSSGTASGENGGTMPRKSPVSRRKQAMAVSLGLILLAVIFALQNYGAIRNFLGAEADTGKPLTLREYVTGYPDGMLELEEKMNSYVVRGAFRDENQRQLFLENLPGADKQVELNVRLVDDILNSVRHSFNFYGLRVNPVPEDDGAISIFGYVRDKYAEAEIMKSIKKDLPFVYSHLVPRFTYRSDLEERLTSLSQEAGLSILYLYGRGFIAYRGQFSMDDLSKIAFIRDEISKIVRGPVPLVSVQDLSPDELESVRGSENDVKEPAVQPGTGGMIRTSDVPARKNAGGTVRPGTSRPSSGESPASGREFSARDVASVNVSGKIGFFTAKNGILYFEGSRLPDGAVVSSIGNDLIILRKNGREVKINLK